jgi:hypothetical protein
MSSPIAAGARLARSGRLLAALLATTTVAALAALPAADAAGTQVSVPPTEQVESLLGKTPLESLPTAELTEKLSGLPALEGVEAGALEKAVKEVIELLKGKGGDLEELLKGGEGATLLKEKLTEALGPLGSKLEQLLGGNPQVKLEEILSSLGIKELLGKLLSGSGEPQALIQQILSALTPEKLQSVLGTLPAGTPVATTLEQLASELGTTPQALAEEFGKTAEQLPATTMALVAPLADGEKLGVVNGAEGVTLGLIKGAENTAGLTGGTGGPGGSGGAGGSPSGQSSSPAPAPATVVAAANVGKLKVLSHSFKDHRATIVVEVPAAGVLTLSGKRLLAVRHETDKAERVTLHPTLTRAGVASVRKSRRRGLKVPIKVAFKPVGGTASTATVSLTYH